MKKDAWIAFMVTKDFVERLNGHVAEYEKELHKTGVPVTLSRSALVRIVLEQWMAERE